MEFHDLEFSKYTKFTVVDVEDYNIKGSFDPESASDIEFYGYRETTFRVASAQGKDSVGWWTFDEDELRSFSEQNDSAITLMVQNQIDKQNGDIQ